MYYLIKMCYEGQDDSFLILDNVSYLTDRSKFDGIGEVLKILQDNCIENITIGERFLFFEDEIIFKGEYMDEIIEHFNLEVL